VYASFITAKQDKKWCAKYHINYRSLARAVEVRQHLRKYLKRWNVRMVSCDNNTDTIRKCIIHGYFANAAQLQPDGSYRTIRGSHV
jgi:ATP-dependent RNA helicase DDX35